MRRAASWRHGVGPASNIYVDFDAAMRVVHETIESVIAAGAARQEIALGLGLAGVSDDEGSAAGRRRLARLCAHRRGQ